MRAPIAALAVLLLAGCSTAPATTVAPSTAASVLETVAPTESAGASVAPSPSVLPTASPEPTHGVGTLDTLPPGAAIEVAVKELNLRNGPSTSARKIATLKRGTILVTSPMDGRSFGWGPVKANGYHWYPVAEPLGSDPNQLSPLPANPLDFKAEPVWGWIAADDGTRPYVSAIAPRCPATVDLTNVQAMLPAERLACFGEPFVLEGTFGCGGCGGTIAATYKPEWLASPLEFDFLSVDAEAELGPIALHFAPSGPAAPTAGSIIRVTVHVDDSRSSRCQASEMNDHNVMEPVNATSIRFWCRERLVVDSYEITGTDPDFPS